MPYSEHAHSNTVASILSSLSALRNGLGTFLIPLLPAMKFPPVDLRGKQAIVTGANSGIGFETAKSLAKMGAHVVLACRNKDKAEQARKSIASALDKESQVDRVEVQVLDCASLESVREFVQRWGTRSTTTVDILVNNAGNTLNTLTTTADGLEGVYQSNHIAHVLLTLSLLKFGYFASDARIVNVSSIAFFSSPALDEHNTDSSDITNKYKVGERLSWETMTALYSRAKASQAVWSMTLQRKLQSTANWKNIIVQACHPGLVKSAMLSQPDGAGGTSGSSLNTFRSLVETFGMSTEQGAVVPVWLATAQEPTRPDMRGLYWDRMRWMWVAPWSIDTQRQDRLWNKWCSDAGLMLL